MKLSLLLLLTCLYFSAFAQNLADSIPVDSVTRLVQYDSVIEVKGSKDELYSKAKIWFADAFKNAKYVLQTEDKEAGTLVGKGSLDYSVSTLDKKKKKPSTSQYYDHSDFTIKVFLKDNKYRYIISDITLTQLVTLKVTFDEVSIIKMNSNYNNGNQDSYTYHSFAQAHRQFLNLIKSLNSAMQKKSETDF